MASFTCCGFLNFVCVRSATACFRSSVFHLTSNLYVCAHLLLRVPGVFCVRALCAPLQDCAARGSQSAVSSFATFVMWCGSGGDAGVSFGVPRVVGVLVHEVVHVLLDVQDVGHDLLCVSLPMAARGGGEGARSQANTCVEPKRRLRAATVPSLNRDAGGGGG